MIRKIDESIFNDKTQDDDRVLFDIDGYRLIDGDKYTKKNEKGEVEEKEQSYFLFDDNKKNIYELTLQQAYDLLALYADKDVEEGVLIEDIMELIESV